MYSRHEHLLQVRETGIISAADFDLRDAMAAMHHPRAHPRYAQQRVGHPQEVQRYPIAGGIQCLQKPRPPSSSQCRLYGKVDTLADVTRLRSQRQLARRERAKLRSA